MKKIVFFGILGVFLMFFGSSISAQETKESSLTPRQMLLLQIPENFSITSGSVTWEVTYESGEPLEAITIINAPEIVIYFTLGLKPRAIVGSILTATGDLNIITLGKFDDNGVLETFESPYNLNPEIIKDIGAAITKTVKEILEAFNVETDEKLSELIKKNVTGKKAAVAL